MKFNDSISRRCWLKAFSVDGRLLAPMWRVLLHLRWLAALDCNQQSSLTQLDANASWYGDFPSLCTWFFRHRPKVRPLQNLKPRRRRPKHHLRWPRWRWRLSLKWHQQRCRRRWRRWRALVWKCEDDISDISDLQIYLCIEILIIYMYINIIFVSIRHIPLRNNTWQTHKNDSWWSRDQIEQLHSGGVSYAILNLRIRPS